MEHGSRYGYALELHVRISVCEYDHAFTLKREAGITASSPLKRKRALEFMEDTLRRHEKNRIRMASMRDFASMRASETLHVKLHKKRKNKEAMPNARTRTVLVEGAIAVFLFEVKQGPCTSVLRMVLHDIIINKVYIASLYTIFRIAHQGTFINHRCACTQRGLL